MSELTIEQMWDALKERFPDAKLCGNDYYTHWVGREPLSELFEEESGNLDSYPSLSDEDIAAWGKEKTRLEQETQHKAIRDAYAKHIAPQAQAQGGDAQPKTWSPGPGNLLCTNCGRHRHSHRNDECYPDTAPGKSFFASDPSQPSPQGEASEPECLCDEYGSELCRIHRTRCIECGQRLPVSQPKPSALEGEDHEARKRWLASMPACCANPEHTKVAHIGCHECEVESDIIRLQRLRTQSPEAEGERDNEGFDWGLIERISTWREFKVSDKFAVVMAKKLLSLRAAAPDLPPMPERWERSEDGAGEFMKITASGDFVRWSDYHKLRELKAPDRSRLTESELIPYARHKTSCPLFHGQGCTCGHASTQHFSRGKRSCGHCRCDAFTVGPCTCGLAELLASAAIARGEERG